MEERVIGILKDFTDIQANQIGADFSLRADLGLSSLDVMDLVVTFEDEFGISIPDEDILEFITVGDIVKYLEDHRA